GSCAAGTARPRPSRRTTCGAARCRPTWRPGSTRSRSATRTAGAANSGPAPATASPTECRSGAGAATGDELAAMAAPTVAAPAPLLQVLVDAGEGLDARMAVALRLGARLRIVLAAVEQHGAHAGIACGVQFLDHVGQEHDVSGLDAELA